MFELTKEQCIKLNDWQKELDKKIIEKQRTTLKDFDLLTDGGKYPYSGAIGGLITYMFTPTELGTVTKVRHEMSKKEIDLTEYEDW